LLLVKELTNVLAPALNMKTVSEDKSYIDYTYGNFGVRVWKDHCQAIRRDDDASGWVGEENILPVPVLDSILGFPHAAVAPVNALAFQVAKYDDRERDPELRGLLKGWMTFEEAISTR
jgi:hypothetical protein